MGPHQYVHIDFVAGEDRILVLYVPGARLLKYRAGFTFNGDVIVSETIVVGLPMTVYRQQSFGVYAHPPPSLSFAVRGVRGSGCV